MDQNSFLTKYRSEVEAELASLDNDLQRQEDDKKEAEIKQGFLSMMWQQYPGFNVMIQKELEQLTQTLRDYDENQQAREEKRRRAKYLQYTIQEIDAILSR